MSLYYEDEFVQLHHGDCRAVRGWTTADVLVTDPPYGIAWSAPERKAKGHTSRAHDGIANDHDLEALTDVLSMWGDKPAAVFGSPVGGKPPEVKQTLVWQKSPDSGFFGTVGGFRRDWEAVHLTGKWPPGPAERSSVYRQQTGLPGYLGGADDVAGVGMSPRHHCRSLRGFRFNPHRRPEPGAQGDRRGTRGALLRAHRQAPVSTGIHLRRHGGIVNEFSGAQVKAASDAIADAILDQYESIQAVELDWARRTARVALEASRRRT
jgi:hypothetical protein